RANAFVHHGVEADEPEDAPHFVMARTPVRPLLQDRHVVDEVERTEAAMEPGFLRQVAEPAPDRETTGGCSRVRAVNAYRAPGRSGASSDAETSDCPSHQATPSASSQPDARAAAATSMRIHVANASVPTLSASAGNTHAACAKPIPGSVSAPAVITTRHTTST